MKLDTARGPGAGSSFALSPMQHAMLVDRLRAPGSGVDIEQRLLALPADIDLRLLQRAWQRVAAHHEMLRASFHWQSLEAPVQEIHDTVDWPFEILDWSTQASPGHEDRIHRFLQADRERGFDLTEAPLARVTILRLGADEDRLVWTNFHGILDGRATGMVLEQVVRVYEGLRDGSEIELPACPPFRDYIEWLERQADSSSEAFWRQYLAGLRAPTLLRESTAPSGRGSVPFEQVSRRLSGQVTSALRQLVDRGRLTMNTVVQGAWALLLSRYSGQQDVLYGAVKSCRRSSVPGADRIIGPLLATLPFRVSVDPEQPLVAWLEGLRAQWLELRAHEHSPLHRIREWSEIPQGTSLFESIFVFDHEDNTAPIRRVGGPWLRRSIRAFEQPPFPLSLSAFDGTELALQLDHDPVRFERAFVEGLLQHLASLLEAMASHPDALVGDLALSTAAERQRVLVDWNDTTTPYPRDECIHALFEAQATQTPDATAVECEGESLTYAELNRRANQVAHHLIGLGVGPEVKVGIAVERSVEMVVGILGVLKAGGAYVPLDPTYPPDRLSFMVRDTQAPVVLTQAHLEAELPAHGGTALRLDADWQRFAAEPETNPDPATGATSLAYVMYTSGSTGRPKGVCVAHRSVIRLVRNTNYLTVTPSDVFLQLAPISFDAATLELWASLLNGASLVVFPPWTPSLAELGRALQTHGITTLWLTGALFQQMATDQPDTLTGIRQLLAGGDALSALHVRRVIARLHDQQHLINGYGPTENTTFTCCHVMGAGSEFSRSVPIGRPIANTTAYILDGNLEPVPVGVAGQLATGGDGLARGYLNDPALTAARFVPNPFGDEPGSRLYLTGDRARYDADGTIEFLGRVDYQVKLRGFRIELGEIQAALLRQAGVRDAVVLCREDTPDEKRLVAYVTWATDAPPSPTELRSGLGEILPGYMIPSAFVPLDGLPLTANGKIDRTALPVPDDEHGADVAFVAPSTETERRVAAIWADVLRQDRVGVHDSFLERGGHSLLATRVVSRMRDAFGVEVPLSRFFERPTVASLAEYIDLCSAWEAEGEVGAVADEGESGEL